MALVSHARLRIAAHFNGLESFKEILILHYAQNTITSQFIHSQTLQQKRPVQTPSQSNVLHTTTKVTDRFFFFFFYLRRHHCVGRGSHRVVILLERRRGNGLSADREHERGLPALDRPHRKPFERSVHRLVHGSDWTRSLPRLLMRQVHDVRLVHRSGDNLGVGAARSRSNSHSLFSPLPPFPPRRISPSFPLFSSSSAHRLALVPKCGGIWSCVKRAERSGCVRGCRAERLPRNGWEKKSKPRQH